MVDGVSVVIPTVGRASLAGVLCALGADGPPPVPMEVLVVDDRAAGAPRLATPPVPGTPVRQLTGRGSGPAAARNTGWRAARYPWVVFLDDDVVPEPGWSAALAKDLTAPPEVGGVQGRVRVPLPPHRAPTDWERCTAGLAEGRWITADMAYRRDALVSTGGFDEQFRRAYREDAELAYRVTAAGWRLARGDRMVTHPVRPEGPWVSLRMQRGNADDALLRRMYGPAWRRTLNLPGGRRPRHVAITVAGAVALVAAVTRRRRSGLVTAALWTVGVAELTAARLAPGPRTWREVCTVAATSMLLPQLATLHWWRGWWRHRKARPLSPGRS